MKTMAIIILILFTLSGCGVANYSPVVDRPGPNYQQDLAECRALAEQRVTGAEGGVAGAAIGAGIGAIIGVGIGLIFGVNAGRTAAAGAIGGGASGGVGSAVQAHNLQKTIVVNCLVNRGHAITGF